MIRTIILIPMFAALLACGPFTQPDDPTAQVRETHAAPAEATTEVPADPAAQVRETHAAPAEATTEVPADPAAEVRETHTAPAEATADPLPTSEEAERTVEVTGEIPIDNYGDTSIEQKILENDAIVRARMTSLASEVFVDSEGKHRLALKFSLDVSEYLKGSGPSSVVAVWVDGRHYDTSARADTANANTLAVRDDQWDDMEAIIFLYDGASGFGILIDEQLRLADHFFLGLGHRYFDDDRYSLHSTRYKAWFPAVTRTGSTNDAQEFLLDVPRAAGTAPTITLGDLKAEIAAVATEIDGGDGSDAYETCVAEQYEIERVIRYFREEEDTDAYDKSPQVSNLASGQPIGTQLYQRQNAGIYPDQKAKTWFEGRDAALFTVTQGEPTAFDVNGDGSFTAESDGIEFTETFATARPLPAGEYEIIRKEVWPRYLPCNYVLDNEWTVTITAPEGTLHEAFFDPITDGTAVAADATNGVLKPATFTDADSASATLERIAWESGTVKFELSSDDALAGQVANFIELDGTVSLSLNADDATVDAANDTLSWSAASQPWEDGDKLMLRIREAQGTCWNGTAVPNLSVNPGLASDCTALLAAKDTLRGTAVLNWSGDTAITSWDGVTVDGTPSRVTEIRLPEKGLTGAIPKELANLTALKVLRLGDNQLTGSIPSELASLTNLADLRLYSNRLSGGIPTELGSLSNLVALHLDDNQLTGSIPTELGSLSNLRDLFLGKNQLTGGIPTQLGSLSNLRFMNLDDNQLTGGIPTQLGSLTNLQDLSLSGNQLTGSIPTQLGDLTKLRDLFLNDNQLTGTIPTQLGKLAALELLELSGNGLTGTIPTQLGKLSKLESLYLRNNSLTGAIPTQLGSLSNLEVIWLSGNTLTGCIPAALRNIDDHDLAKLKLQYCPAPEA